MKTTLVPFGGRLPANLWDFRREMENLFTRALGEDGENNWLAEMAPRVNLAETEKAYEVTAELPGLKPEDIRVELERDVLTITGEKKEEAEEKGKTFHRVERRFGTFRRTIALPDAAAADKVNAEYKEGVLVVTVPKAKEAKATRIKVAG